MYLPSFSAVLAPLAVAVPAATANPQSGEQLTSWPSRASAVELAAHRTGR